MQNTLRHQQLPGTASPTDMHGASPADVHGASASASSGWLDRSGWLDGNLGVIYALEAARALAEDPATAGLAVDIASWTDEEGSYLGYFGSRSFLNYDLADQIEAATGHPRVTPGNSLPEAIAAAGLENHPRTVAEKGRYLGFFEAHIEQGPHLEQFGLNIGVVTDIVGSRGYTILFKGEQNHAGTTPMALRRDAGMASLAEAAQRRVPHPPPRPARA